MIRRMTFLGGEKMTVEGYFDGTAVRTLEPVDLKPQQKVFIHIPNSDFSESENNQIEKNLAAVHSVFGMLSNDETNAVDDSIKTGIKLKEIDL